MIPELGHFALIIALVISIVQGVVPLIGAHKNNAALMAIARPAALTQFLFVGLAYAALTHAFIVHDFSVLNVAKYSNLVQPLQYRITGVWGSHEGSLLLWVLIHSIWLVALAAFSHNLPQMMISRVLAVMSLVGSGFLSFLLFTSNPFTRIFPAPLDGDRKSVV